ncbi:hypothetical protein L211DRAFT_882338 [Terfezia boudieri ATCC MYA-4762]|uniref:Uncharacterized protein n=1 Tax=Terfezia boudieri ATCC MYA-4762 TaxID=1051890 RepID=A0A3N4LKF3_9PEZI|nr:hypothetical protein L211DRAFT_882338 [Terfezia boudieri ATCC MYA-4762]
MAPNTNTILFSVWPETRESALSSCRVAPTYPAHHEHGNVLISTICLLVFLYVAFKVFDLLSSGLVSDAFASLDGVSRPPRPRFFGAGFFEGTDRTVSCVVSGFLAVVGVAGHVCMGAGRVLSCVISWLLVVVVIARHPRAFAWSYVSSIMAWLSGRLEQVNQGRASVSSSETSMPGAFPAPLVIVVPDSIVHSLASPISVPNAASQVPVVAIKKASACPSKPTPIDPFRPGRCIEYIHLLYRDRSVVSVGNSAEQASASHSVPVSHELEAVRTLQKSCVEASGTPTAPIALLLCEEGQPGVKTHRYAGNAVSGSPYKITVVKKSPALRGVQQTRKSAPLVSHLTPSWMAAPLVTEALSVACKLGSMFGLKVHQGEQVDVSDRSHEDEMDFEPTSTVVAPVDREVLMQDAPDLIDDDSSTDKRDWEPAASRLSLEEEGFLVRIFSALSLGPKLNCIADRVQKPASSGIIAEQSVSSGSEPALKNAVSTVSQAPVEVNRGPHAPSATPKTETTGRIILRLRGKKVPGKEVAESAVAKTLPLTTSTAVPPQAEVQTAVPTSGNGEGDSSSGNPPTLTASGPSANTESQPEQPSCESTGQNGPAVIEPAAATNSPVSQAGPATPGRALKRWEVKFVAQGQGVVDPTTTAEKLAFLRKLAAKTISKIDPGLLGPNDRERLMKKVLKKEKEEKKKKKRKENRDQKSLKEKEEKKRKQRRTKTLN